MNERDEKGRFLPGSRPVGRKKGTANKSTTELRERYQDLLDSYSIDQMKMDLMQLNAKERLQIISSLLDFFMPKLNRSDHILSNENQTIIIQLPDDNRPIESQTIQSNIPATVNG